LNQRQRRDKSTTAHDDDLSFLTWLSAVLPFQLAMSLKHQASYLSLLLYEPAALSLNPRVFTQSSLFEVRYAQKSTYVRKYFYIRCLGLGLCGTFREMYGLLMSRNLHAVPRQPRRRCSSRARSHHVTWDSLPFGKDSHSHRVSALTAHRTVTDRATSGFRRGRIALSQADARDARSRNGECKTMDATTRRSEPHKY
jgi:hypothetical protein